MDENKNTGTPNENGLSGFDSVSNITPKQDGQFNPTPMFSGMNSGQKSGYAVTPEGSFYTTPTQPAEASATESPKTEEPAAPVTSEPAGVPEAPKAPTASTEQSAVNESAPIASEVKPEAAPEPAPTQNSAPSFIPSGTYSYSAAKGDLKSSAFETPNVNPTTPPVYSAPTYTTPTPTPPPIYNPKPKKEKKPKKPKKYGAGVVIISAVLAAVIGAGGGIGAMLLTGNSASNTVNAGETASSSDDDTSKTVTNITVDETVNSSIEAVAKKAGPSIVGIRTTAAVTNFFGGSSETTGEGSGIIYTSDGYIITNYHVIESAVESSNSKVEVFLADDADTAISATVIGYNIAYDLAVVKIEKTGLSAIEFADSDKLSVGQYAVAIGNPGGLEFMGSVSYGVISGLNRSVTVDTGNTMSLIQTDAAINPGNSGGALVDISGKLIGVNSIKLVSTGYEGMGFAIPSNTVKEICTGIIDKQNDPAPYIGIQISQNYTASQLNALGYPAGAVVVSVVDGGPADESGIKRGDIITELGGTEISSYSAFESAISQCKPGDTVAVKIYRAGRFYSTNVNIESNSAQ